MEKEIYIYGIIGEQVKAAEIVPIVNSLAISDVLKLKINSVGGDVYEGLAIYNALKNCKANTEAIIDSYCGSIATIIACGCANVVMSEHGSFMIHNPSTGISGERKHLQLAVSELADIENKMANIYAAKTGLSNEDILKIMSEETTYNVDDAINKGFVNGRSIQLKAVAMFNKKENKMENNEEIKGLFAEIKSMFTSIKKSNPRALDLTLEDGTKITSDAGDTDSLVGSSVTISDTGEVLSNGDYVLATKDILSVEDGKVTDFKPVDATMDKMKTEIEALKAENESLKAEKETIVSEKTALNETVLAIKNKYEALEKKVIIATSPARKEYSKEELESNTKFEAANAKRRSGMIVLKN